MAALDTAQSRKDVTIDKMDYSYIEKCSNEKEVESILKALKSGREGYYPDLINFCEKRLEAINPKNKALRKQQKILKLWDLQKEDRQNLDEDMENWSEEMTKMEQKKSPANVATSAFNGFGDHGDLPPVRGSHVLKGTKKKQLQNGVSASSNPDRIKSGDYKAWDKFDVEKECEKIDTENETPAPSKRTISISKEVGAAGLTEEEKEIKAVREKEKGNEAFKSGDFEEALSYYCRSISLHPIAASYNNRALVHLRLQQWEEAIEDCDMVLGFPGEEGNLKAMLRRATALKALESYSKAKKDLLYVLGREPNNARAKTIMTEIEKLESAPKEKKNENSQKTKDAAPYPKQGKKMVITEVDGDSEEDEGDDAVNQNAGAVAEEHSLPSKDDAPESLKPKVGAESSKSSDSHPRSEHQKTQDVKDAAASKDQQESPPLRDPLAVQSELKKRREGEVDSSKMTKKDTGNTNESFSLPNSSEDPKSETPLCEISEDASKEQAPSPPVEPKYPALTEKLKMKAGEFFKSGRYDDACEHYTKAINSLVSHVRSENADPGYKIASALLHNNRAACWLKQGNDKACVSDCTEVLGVKRWDAKALMRRAMAYEHMEKYDKAWADYQSAYSMDWQNALAQNGANRAAKHLREIHGVRWREKVPKIAQYQHYDQRTLLTHRATTSNTLQKDTSVPKTSSPNVGKVSSSNGGTVLASSAQKIPASPTIDDKGARPKSKQPTSGGKGKSKKRNKSKSKPPVKNDGPSEKEKAELQKKRAKITRDLFEKLKGEGNEHVKAGDYDAAVECYTRCLALCPEEPASYTNRSLCFLKLKKHVSAINDCTEAIKLDPRNVKAYYRRALAKKAEGFLHDAERDIVKVLDIDPANKAARKELGLLNSEALLKSNRTDKPINKEQNFSRDRKNEDADKPISKEQNLSCDQKNKSTDKPISKEQNLSRDQKSTQKPKFPRVEEGGSPDKTIIVEQNLPRKKQLPIEVVDSSSSDEAEFVLPNEEVTKFSEVETTKVEKTTDGDRETGSVQQNLREASKIAEKERVSTGKANSTSKKEATDGDQSKLIAASEPALRTSEKSYNAPSTEKPTVKIPRDATKPLTPYEFGNAWSSIPDKSNHGEYKALLDLVAPKDLPALLSNKIDDHVISVVSRVATDHLTSDRDFQRAYDMLRYLTKAARFSMAILFLSDSDKKLLHGALDALAPHVGEVFTAEDLNTLREAYGM